MIEYQNSMLITYPSKHSWYKNAMQESLQHYGNSDRKKLQKTSRIQDELAITAAITSPDEDFFSWFIPLYEDYIGTKNNAAVADVRGTTVDKIDSEHEYKVFKLFENNTPVGGCIFSVRPNALSIAYRVFNKSWYQDNIPASPALFGEYLLDKYCYEAGKDTLIHGLDRNPYGINSAIGLCIFKLAVGCSCEIPSSPHEVNTISVEEITQDQLILHYPTSDTQINTATLVITSDTENAYKQLFKYPDRLKVNTIYR